MFEKGYQQYPQNAQYPQYQQVMHMGITFAFWKKLFLENVVHIFNLRKIKKGK
jgi:hypothetical protein